MTGGTTPSLWEVNNPTGTAGLFAVDKVGGKALFFDPATFALDTAIAIKGAHELIIDADHRFAYVAEFGKWGRDAKGMGALIEAGAMIWVIDLAKKEAVARIDTWPHLGPHGMKFDLEGRLWVTFESNAIGLFDVRKRRLIGLWPLGEPAQPPRVMEISHDGTYLFLAGKGADIIVFDTVGRCIVNRIPLPKGGTTLSMSADGTSLITFDRADQALLVIDVERQGVANRVPLGGAVLSGPKVSNLVHGRFSSDGRWFASSNYAGGSISLHDANTLESHSTLHVAKGPQGMAFTPDGTRLLVSNHDCGMLTIVDLSMAQVTGWVPAGDGVEALTFY